jgi:hypothetical protein
VACPLVEASASRPTGRQASSVRTEYSNDEMVLLEVGALSRFSHQCKTAQGAGPVGPASCPTVLQRVAHHHSTHQKRMLYRSAQVATCSTDTQHAA